MGGDITCENRYCSFHVAMDKAKQVLSRVAEEEIIGKVNKFIENNNFQLAESLLSRGLSLNPNRIDLLNLFGYVHFRLGNYEQAKQSNLKTLELDPHNAYAYKGLGLALARLGEVDAGIEFLQKAIALASADFWDPYYDLAVILLESERKDEAAAVIEEGCKRSADFRERSKSIYQQFNLV
jgi:tetratricopeptide (TPR) repeat protein